jgi:hypothetical protein
VANAWSWPVHGVVLQPFAYDETHPYAAGQHRGVDIAADSAGETVTAPAAGTIGFAGAVPTNGLTLTIDTADGYAVTLTHLGTTLVPKGATVAEGDAVATVGLSGTAEVDGPYVHLGIRVAADPNGYVDPLSLLPAPTAETPPPPGSSTAAQPTATGEVSAPTEPPATLEPTPIAASSVALSRAPRPSSAQPGIHHSVARRPSRRADATSDAQRPRLSQRPAAKAPAAAAATPSQTTKPRQRLNRPTSSSRRPVVEPAAQQEPTGLDVGHQAEPRAPVVASPARPRRRPSPVLVPLALNGAAALLALTAALLAALGRRRRRVSAGLAAGAEILRLPAAAAESLPERRAA